MADEQRVVRDGGSMGYWWRCFVEPCESAILRRPGWRWFAEKHHIGWDHYLTSRRYRTEAEARAAANKFLDSMNASPHSEARPV